LADEVRPQDREPEVRQPSGPVDPGAETIGQSETPETRSSGEAPAGGRKSRRCAPLRCQEFGDYSIVEEVARGAMGIVYRAEQKRLGREVALKVMLTGEHASDGEVRRFTREAQALARLRHPNIVPIYDIGEVDGRHYFTMDFVEGQTLSQVLQERRLTVTEALHIIEQTADAVAAAHTRGVIHRDIKPSNIMLDPDGNTRIMDFGLSKSTGAETKHTRDGTTIGTPAYMPPEQARGELSRVDERSDIYSMGAVLYEMLAGRPPFGGTNLLEIVLAVINEDPPRPRTVNPRLSRELETIIVKCMEKDPARRYQTAAELRDEIRRYQAGEPIHAQPPSLFYLLRKKLAKHRVILTMTTATLLILAGAGGAVWHIWKYKPPVEVTRAEWVQLDDCDFSPEELARDWSTANNFHDYYLQPFIAEPRATWRSSRTGRTIISKKPVYGSARAVLRFRLKAPLGAKPQAFGFYGERMSERSVAHASCIFRISSGHVQLFAHVEPDTRIQPRVVADRHLPRLKVGGMYRLTVERHGINLRFTLEQEERGSGSTPGKRLPVAELVYAHPNLSNWRYKNLKVVLRTESEQIDSRGLQIERLALPKQTSALVAADRIFFRGDYNGAVEEYNLIAAPRDVGGVQQTPLERATANYRLGLYYETKRELHEAMTYYENVRTVLPAGTSPGDPRDRKAYRDLCAEALLRQIGVCASAAPSKIYSLLGDLTAVPDEHLSGPLVWGLGEALPQLAERRPGYAVELAGHLRPPPGSAVMGRDLLQTARTLSRRKMGARLNELMKRWLPQLKPVPQPLPGWALMAARAGDGETSRYLFSTGWGRLQAEERKYLIDAAIQACGVFRKRREFNRVNDIITASGFDVSLKESFREALASAVGTNRRAALDMLRRASRSKSWAGDKGIAALAVELGEKYCTDGKYSLLHDLDDAFHTPLLAGVYAKAVKALRATEAPVGQSFDLLREAHERFGGKHAALTGVATDIGALYAGCANENDYKMVLGAYAAYPTPKHIVNMHTTFLNLKTKGRYDQVGEVFAFCRAQRIADRRMKAMVRELLEHQLFGEDLVAFMAQLSAVEPQLAADRRELALWRMELARYYLLGSDGDWLSAADAYRRASDKRGRAPEKLRTEALLRLVLLKALGENKTKGDRAQTLELLAALGKLARKGSRALLIARMVRDRDLLGGDKKKLDAFRKRAEELKMSPSLVQLVLAANASMATRPAISASRDRYLAEAYRSITQAEKSYAWPYELLYFKQQAAARFDQM